MAKQKIHKIIWREWKYNCDLNANKIKIHLRENKEILSYDFSSITRNEIFIKELENFICFVKGTEEPKVDIKRGFEKFEIRLDSKIFTEKEVLTKYK